MQSKLSVVLYWGPDASVRGGLPDIIMTMHHHLTPTELANRLGSDEKTIVSYCQELGIPVLHGRIDYVLFETALKQYPELEETLTLNSV